MASWLTGSRGKLILALVLLLGAGGLAFWQTRSTGGLPDKVNFVCVETGKFYALSRYDVPMLPAKNPDSRARTLLPCLKGEDGVVRVSSRCRTALGNLGEKNRYVDAQTLEIRGRE